MPNKMVSVRLNTELDADLLADYVKHPQFSDYFREKWRESLKPKAVDIPKKPESEPQGKAEPAAATAAPPAPDSKDELTDAELEEFIKKELEKEKPKNEEEKKIESEKPTPEKEQPTSEVMQPNFYCDCGEPFGYFNPLASDVVQQIRGLGRCKKCGGDNGNWK